MTKYGPVKTDYILFIAAGAIHRVKPSDLVPELRGSFSHQGGAVPSKRGRPGQDPYGRPENSLLRQYKALLGTEGVSISFREMP
jgi:ATP-dependent HslUV protease ATP-binding subunit HslU